MARLYIDCRKYPSEKNCTVSISADTRHELVEAAVQHAVAVHGHTDGPQLRDMIGQAIQQDGPAASRLAAGQQDRRSGAAEPCGRTLPPHSRVRI